MGVLLLKEKRVRVALAYPDESNKSY